MNRLICAVRTFIESLFGKFKYALNPANPSEITELALTIPCSCGSLDVKEVKMALENVTNEQVKNWRKGSGKPAATNEKPNGKIVRGFNSPG